MADDSERSVDKAERDMEAEIERLEGHRDRLEGDIEDAREDLDEMHRVTGDDGGDVAGDWRDADGERGDRGV